MGPNVFFLSDASFDSKRKEAGIAVKNLHDGSFSIMSIRAISPNEAEEFALIEAISLALSQGYRNCIFVYDSLAIDTNPLDEFFSPLVDKIQFLWLKRSYLSDVDQLARRVKVQNIHNSSGTSGYMSVLCQKKGIIEDHVLIAVFMRLTQGAVYDYLQQLSGMASEQSSFHSKKADEMIITLLFQLGSKELQKNLKKQFDFANLGKKHSAYNNFLNIAGFAMHWFDDALIELEQKTKKTIYQNDISTIYRISI
ncbi:MAG: hypothetical protein WA099_04420 [Sulfuricurvum sp.]